jgi:hypothetical protein
MPQRITGPDGHYFFGYYDVPFMDKTNRYHLCHKAPFIDRLPEKDDSAEIGMIDLMDGSRYVPLAATTAWNFQQGAFLRWHPAKSDCVIYNVRTASGYASEILNVRTGEKEALPLPLATVAPDGKRGLSVNFSRMFDFRPGYGYNGFGDENYDVAAPEDDGIFLVDLETKAVRLVLSLSAIRDFLKSRNSHVAEGKILVNHINFNTSGTYFAALVRTFATGENEWSTATLTGRYDGTDLYLLSDYKLASHYFWKNEDELLIWAAHRDGTMLYLLKNKSDEYIKFTDECFKLDGHCSYSDDKNYILYDSYPDSEGYRHLFVYDVKSGAKARAYKFKSIAPKSLDIRCDLHPRFMPGTKNISFDSTHEGFRGIYILYMR